MAQKTRIHFQNYLTLTQKILRGGRWSIIEQSTKEQCCGSGSNIELHQTGMLNLDTHQSEKQDPDSIVKKAEANTAAEAHPRAVETHKWSHVNSSWSLRGSFWSI
jgi:hypothetical protein